MEPQSHTFLIFYLFCHVLSLVSDPVEQQVGIGLGCVAALVSCGCGR